MFCSKCGFQVADGAAFCPGCGNKIEVAPVASAQPVYQAPVAPVYNPVAPVYPAAVTTQPAPKKNLTWLWILLGVLVVAGITIGVLFATGVLGDGKGNDEGGVKNDPEAVAKAYIEAQFEGDMEERFSLMAGDMQTAFEDSYESYETMVFNSVEEQASEYDIEVEVEDWDDFYSANKTLTKAAQEEAYGKGYKITLEVEEATEMDESDLERTIAIYHSSEYADYIDVENFEEGATVTVKVTIYDDEGDEAEDYERTITVIKYDGKWKVLDSVF